MDSGKCFVPTSHGTYEMQIKQRSKFKFRFYLRGFVLAFSFSELVMDSFELKPFPCTVCRKRFKTDNGRASHQKAVHEKLVMASRSKPFECTVCSKRFTTAKGLAAHHRAVHDGLVMASVGSKLFECTVCSKRFSTDNGRADHQIAVHVDKGNYFVPVSRFSKFECGAPLTERVPFAF